MTANHVSAHCPTLVEDVYTHAAWYLSRCYGVPTSQHFASLCAYCDHVGVPRPPWDGDLQGVTSSSSAVGRKLRVYYLDEETHQLVPSVGTVTQVTPFYGLTVALDADGSTVGVTSEDPWEWVVEGGETKAGEETQGRDVGGREVIGCVLTKKPADGCEDLFL